MIVVHHLAHSRSQRILWLLEELGLPYEVRRYERDAKTWLAPPELRKVHPLGKSPVLTEGEITLAESGAIIEELLERHGAGSGLMPPAGSEARRRCRYWLHFAEGSAMPPLLLQLIFDQLKGKAVPFFIRPITASVAKRLLGLMVTPQLKAQFDFMEAELARGPWFAGEHFSAADIQMSFPLEAALQRGGLDERWPRLKDFLARIHARPAYQRALSRGGEYRFAKAS